MKSTRAVFFLLVLLCGLVWFARNAHLQLASDDIGWLRGEAPTVFDQYRLIPRLFFAELYAQFGPSPVAALAMIFFFHLANTALVYSLCQKLLDNRTAAGVAAAVFMINPITLATLTWISCFSYVLGTSLALLSLLAFCKSKDTERRLPWYTFALLSYGLGLFCSHEVLFLPVLFLLFSWLWQDVSRKGVVVLSGTAMALGASVNFFFYSFDRYGVETTRLFSLGFISAFTSSALSFGLTLALAYPLSFFAKPMGFLQFCFAELPRWGITLALLACGILLWKPDKAWRVRSALVLSFVVLITPYIIRLYLVPPGVNYHTSYVLSGRVFYLPFVILACLWGKLVARFQESARAYRLAWALPAASLAAYAYALLILYDKTDFMGLQVVHGLSQAMPPAWTPYRDSQPAWIVGAGLVIIAAAGIRLAAKNWKSRSKHHAAPSTRFVSHL